MDQALDSSTGSMLALHGAIERVATPHFIDAVFPVFAFVMVIVLPFALACWVIYQTVRETTKNHDEI